MDNRLVQAINLIHDGNKPEAGKLLLEIVNENPNDDTVWYYLGLCVRENDHKKHCFNKSVELNPENQLAKDELIRLNEIDFEEKIAEVFEKDSPKSGIPNNLPNNIRKVETDKRLSTNILIGILVAAIFIGLIALQHEISKPKFENLFSLKAAEVTPTPKISPKYYCDTSRVENAFQQNDEFFTKASIIVDEAREKMDSDSSGIMRQQVDALENLIAERKKVEIPPCLENWNKYSIEFLYCLATGVIFLNTDPSESSTQFKYALDKLALVKLEYEKIKACYPNCK